MTTRASRVSNGSAPWRTRPRRALSSCLVPRLEPCGAWLLTLGRRTPSGPRLLPPTPWSTPTSKDTADESPRLDRLYTIVELLGARRFEERHPLGLAPVR